MLESFFNPKSIAVVGVSENPKKLGSLIFQNILNANYKGKIYPINSRIGGEILYGHNSYSKVSEIKEPIDLVIVVVAAKFCSSIIDDCIINGTKNVSIIAAGFSEIGNNSLENEISKKCKDNNINLLGPNCLGHISTYNDLNASFADGYPEKGSVTFISQSGAYCCAMLDWAQKKKIGFSHFISIGNKTNLGENQLLEALKNDEHTQIFVFYLETLKNGKQFLKLLNEVSQNKPCLILEPGRSIKAQQASISHTGSLSPNYKILEKAFEISGAIQARNTRELFGLIEILLHSHHINFSGNVCILTNGGGVGVLSSDLCEENELPINKPSEETIEKLKKVLPNLSSLNNPIDVLGDAKADRYENALRILCESKEYKNIIIFLTPQLGTDDKGTADAIAKLYSEFPDINIYTSFIGGNKVQKGIDILEKNQIINFDFPVDCIRLLGLLYKQNKKSDNLCEIKIGEIPIDIKQKIISAKEKGLVLLPYEDVKLIMDHYKIDYPNSDTFSDKEKALQFVKNIFPTQVIMKINSPDAVHKTEMKGVYPNIQNEESFNKAWDNLMKIINDNKLNMANILIQEMLLSSHEAIIGMNTDNNFGKIMIFGQGGIYTEILNDVSFRILPIDNFNEFINETKIGKILHGVRGQKSKDIGKIVDILKKIQKITLAFPEIISIDINPLLITEEKVIVVDFKVLLQ